MTYRKQTQFFINKKYYFFVDCAVDFVHMLIMDIEYMDILTGEICRQFRLLIWASFIGQFFHPAKGKSKGLKGWIGGIVILAS